MNNEQRTKNPLIKKADELAFLVYKISKNFPKEESYGLTSQLRRAALSVPLNIIEGYARKTSKDYRNFLYIAYGSLKETKYLLYFAKRENYIDVNEYNKLIELSEEIGKILWTTIKNISKKIEK